MDYEDTIEDDGSEKPAASLKARTLIWIGVSVTFFMAIAALLLIYSTKQEMEQAQRTRVNLLTTIQADALAMPLWDYDDTQIKQILSALKRDPDYLGSIVINYDKKSDTTEYKDGNPVLVAGAYAVEREISRMSGEEKVKLGKLTVFVTRNSTEHLFWQQVKASIAAVVVLQFLILGAIYLALRMFTVPLDAMTRAMLALARGDKTIDVPARRRQDEIGRMAAAVQTFKDTAIHADLMDAEQRAEQQRKEQRLKKQELLIEDFNHTTSAVMSGVSQATTRTFETVGSLSHMADDLSLRSQEAMHASHQAAVTVQSVAAAAEELSASIGEISRQVQMSIQTVNDAVEGANEADVTVKSLTEAASKIGSIVEMIHEISEQVSLLALNATIEAARAGPAGKGFAVVASEVKSLATQTAAATDEITRHINTIQTVSGDTAAVIQAIVTTIRQVHEIAASIGSAVEEQGQATLEIARNVQITAAANQEVNESMIVVNEAVFKTRNSAEDMQKAATELQQQIRQLETGITTFLTGIRSE